MFKHLRILMGRSRTCAFGVAVLSVAVIATSAHGQGTIWHVSQHAPPGGTGLTWGSAYKTLDQALGSNPSLLAGDLIKVGQGTYVPPAGVGDPRDGTFVLREGVRIEGGYKGWPMGAVIVPPDANDRDVKTYTSTLSGDFNGDDGPGFTNRSDNAYHVVTAAQIRDESPLVVTILDGFTIRGGQADETALDPDPILAILPGDHRANGAGLYAINSRLNVVLCTFTDNLADSSGGQGGAQGYGAGAYITVDDTAPLAGTEPMDFINCTFYRNQAVRGAVLAASPGAPVRTLDCTTDAEPELAAWPRDLLEQPRRGRPAE